MTASRTEASPVERLSSVDRSVLPADGGEDFNRLIFEQSPYLLQHAENPVDWHPWGEEAFARAAAEEKLVFLSIGYSTCHWCHVMEQEAFEDAVAAAVLNRVCVAIKVDREERPDIDQTYMTVCQMMTGSGGWPLNLLLTPEKRPVFAATYLPKDSRPGQPGLIQILESAERLWSHERESLEQSGVEAEAALRQITALPPATDMPSTEALREALDSYRSSFDQDHVGFGPAPRFPTPHNLALLLRLERLFPGQGAADMALRTLQEIRRGGIYDQLGDGIHRYSVDDRWLVPHFEKMLYDQAMLALACCDAYQFCGEPSFRETAVDTLAYLRRDLRDPGGGFYCGEDADSEGAEGTFYLWTPDQVHEVLGKDLGTIFCRAYNITEEGHFEGKSIPHLQQGIEELASRVKVDPLELAQLLGSARRQLLAARQQRPRPHRDDKVLTAWNGLAIAALARGGAVCGDAACVEAARQAAHFVLGALRTPSGRLLRRWRRGDAATPGFLEDYAFLVWGLIELYQAGFQAADLQEALGLTEKMLELFNDGQGGLFDTGRDAEVVLTRGRSLKDGAIPSGASVAALNLLRLGRLCGRNDLTQRAQALLSSQGALISGHPQAFGQALIALDLELAPDQALVIAGTPGQPDTERLLAEVRRRFLPHLDVHLKGVSSRDLERLAPATAGKHSVDGQATAWLCRERSCLPPTTDARGLGRLLGSEPAVPGNY